MKPALLFLTGALLFCVTPVMADQQTKLQKIDEIFTLTKVDQMQKQILGQVSNAMEAQLSSAGIQDAKALAGEMQQKLMPLFEQKMSWSRMKPGITKLYDETFTEAELDGMLGFYRSPAGRAMLDKMPELTAKSFALSQQMMRDVMPEVMRVSQEVMQKYMAEHPGAAPKAPGAKQ